MHRANIDACSRPLHSYILYFEVRFDAGFLFVFFGRGAGVHLRSGSTARPGRGRRCHFFTFTDARSLKRTKNKCTKLLSVTDNGCRAAGVGRGGGVVTGRFGSTCGSGGRLDFIISLEVCIRAWANTKTPIAGLAWTVNGHLGCSITNTPPGTLREDWMNFNLKLWCYEPALEHSGK